VGAARSPSPCGAATNRSLGTIALRPTSESCSWCESLCQRNEASARKPKLDSRDQRVGARAKGKPAARGLRSGERALHLSHRHKSSASVLQQLDEPTERNPVGGVKPSPEAE